MFTQSYLTVNQQCSATMEIMISKGKVRGKELSIFETLVFQRLPKRYMLEVLLRAKKPWPGYTKVTGLACGFCPFLL